jgi:hypothetical protein
MPSLPSIRFTFFQDIFWIGKDTSLVYFTNVDKLDMEAECALHYDNPIVELTDSSIVHFLPFQSPGDYCKKKLFERRGACKWVCNFPNWNRIFSNVRGGGKLRSNFLTEREWVYNFANTYARKVAVLFLAVPWRQHIFFSRKPKIFVLQL